MSWFNKIKLKAEELDNSRELKKGEIKSILIDNFSERINDFEFMLYKNGTYYFERIRKYNGYDIYETFHVIFALKDKNFACSVSSNFSPSNRYDKNYQTGILTRNIDLIVLKKDTGIIPINEAYYFHNGRIETTTKVVKSIVSDFKEYGIPFLNNRFDSFATNEILNFGLDYIEKLTVDKESLKLQIEKARSEADWIVSRIKHDLYIDLKQKLQNIPNQDKELRQKIPGFAYSLLEFYWERK
jgi:hypothetical protein